jgi:sulfide:quinone oxidoreductase
MSASRVVVLGAGFGGLELTSRLSEELGDDVAVTLIDQNDSFVFGFSKLDVMFGKRRTSEVRSFYRDIAKPGVAFRQEVIRSIDPGAKRVTTDGGAYDADILVVALGADLAPEATPGLIDGGFEFYSVAGAERAGHAVAGFDRGVALISVLGPFFKCPPAPFETAFLLHEDLERRGLRDQCEIKVLEPLPMPIPISQDVSQAILDSAAERDIEFWPQTVVASLDPNARVATLRDGRTLGYDLFLGVPVHCAPPVVVESGLTEDDGWIGVDPANFTTKFPDVYAVGDVTSAPVPRAGVFAEGEARTVADVLLHQLRGGDAPPPYTGAASCYFEWGGGPVAKVVVNFLGGPSPTGSFSPPSMETAAEKADFGTTRRRRWFGTD